jgi:hypothetical protein
MLFKRFRNSQPKPWAVFLSLACVTCACTAQDASPKPEPSGPGILARTWAMATDMSAWQGDGHWRIAFSPYAHHFNYNPEHRHVWALGIERQRPDDWLAGVSYFRNSFGQPSAYAYVGKQFQALFGQEQLFGQLNAGLMYGYRGKYQRKVPLNVNGFSPGALVSVGWRFSKDTSVTAHLLGDAGVMFQFAYELR